MQLYLGGGGGGGFNLMYFFPQISATSVSFWLQYRVDGLLSS